MVKSVQNQQPQILVWRLVVRNESSSDSWMFTKAYDERRLVVSVVPLADICMTKASEALGAWRYVSPRPTIWKQKAPSALWAVPGDITAAEIALLILMCMIYNALVIP